MNFGDVLREERIKKGMSVQQLAEKAHVTTRAIYYWERGERAMSLNNVNSVFEALDISFSLGKGGIVKHYDDGTP